MKLLFASRIIGLFSILAPILFFMSCGSAKVWINPAETIQGVRIAIVGFDMQEQKTSRKLPEIDKQFSDGMAIHFLKSGFNVIERKKINLILEETKLQMSGIVSQAKAIEVGKIAQVDYIVFGSGSVNFTMDDPFIRQCTIKMVNVETGTTVMVANWAGSGKHLGEVTDAIGEQITARFAGN